MKLSNTFDFPSKYPFTLTDLPKVDGGTREIDLNRVCFKIQTYKHLLKGNGLIKGQITKLFILSPFRIMKQKVKLHILYSDSEIIAIRPDEAIPRTEASVVSTCLLFPHLKVGG